RSVAGGDDSSPARARRLTLPDLPWWGGVGPIFWRQLTGALRGLGRLVLVLVLLLVMVAGPLLAGGGQHEPRAAGLRLVLVGVWVPLCLTALVPADFRGDVDRLALLKTLPVPGWGLALGQLLAPTLLLSLVQWSLLGVVAFAFPSLLTVVLAVAV